MKIQIKLKDILAEKGISQRELARLMGIRHPTINHLCSDNVDRVYLETLERICEVLNIDISQLIVLEKECF
jgi:putative transcriptional regulator